MMYAYYELEKTFILWKYLTFECKTLYQHIFNQPQLIIDQLMESTSKRRKEGKPTLHPNDKMIIFNALITNEVL